MAFVLTSANLNFSISELYVEVQKNNWQYAEYTETILSGLPEDFTNRVFSEIWRLDGSRPDAGYNWGKVNATEDMARLKLAVDNVLRKTILEEMPENTRQQVYDKIYESTTITTDDAKGREQHVFDDMLRVAKAVDAVGYFKKAPIDERKWQSEIAAKFIPALKKIPSSIAESPEYKSFKGLFQEEVTVYPTPEILRSIHTYLSESESFLTMNEIQRAALDKFGAADFNPEGNSNVLSELIAFLSPSLEMCENVRLLPYANFYRGCISYVRKSINNSIPSDGLTHWRDFYKLFRQRIALDALNKQKVADFTEISDFYSVNEAVLPTYFGLELLASYYEVKYGVKIYVENSHSFERKIKADGYPKDQPFGVILRNNYTHAGHVMPQLCCYQSGVYEVLTLDSVSESTSDINFRNIPQPKDVPLRTKHLFTQRQADAQSCRNDALIVLVNALLDLREKNTTDFFSYTMNATFFPAPWAKSAQTSYALKKTDDKAPVRTKRGPVSLSSFIASCTREYDIRKRREYLLYKGYRMANIIADMMEDRDKYKAVWSVFESRLKKA